MHFPRLLTIAALAALSVQPVLAATHDLPTASAESEGMSAERLARLSAGMKEIVDSGRLAGAVTMVSRHGKVVEFDAVGKRDIAANAHMQKDSIFRIYSMSKPITGVAMMILFEEGKWQLNDPVAKYIPEFAKLKVYSTDTNGNVAIWNMNSDQITQSTIVATPGSSWHVEGTGDFNGDGKSDIVLQNNNGSVAIWEMNGDQVSHGIVVANPGPNWHVASTGDFNQDGMTDIALQSTNGAVAVWDMDGGQIIHSSVLANPGPTWSVTSDGRHS